MVYKRHKIVSSVIIWITAIAMINDVLWNWNNAECLPKGGHLPKTQVQVEDPLLPYFSAAPFRS